MGEIIAFENIEDLIIEIRGQKVLLDRDVASLYGVETKRINEAVKNNPDRFPNGYIVEIDKDTKNELVENFDRFKTLKHSSVKPKAFTEKGLYMLATILTSKKAIQVSISIIETFTKTRELSRTIKKLPTVTDKKEQQSLMQKSGEIIAEILDDSLETDESETTIELNLAVLKFKHTIKKRKNE
jgi:phage regulator Rha-like protein